MQRPASGRRHRIAAAYILGSANEILNNLYNSYAYISMGPTHPTRLRIGAFCVDASTDEVSRDGVSSKLEPRAMRLLAHLARRAGEVVSVDDLLNTVWGDVVVTPDSVYQAIAMLRRIFDDDPKAPRYIVNVPRRGYRLVAPVSSWAEPAASDSAAGRSRKSRWRLRSPIHCIERNPANVVTRSPLPASFWRRSWQWDSLKTCGCPPSRGWPGRWARRIELVEAVEVA